MPNFRILIADDHEIVRQGVRSLLESHPGWEVCGEAADGWEAVREAMDLKPDLVTLDVGMPNLNGLDAARQMLSDNPHVKILFLTLYEAEWVVKMAIHLGAKGLVLKSNAAQELEIAVEALLRNSTYFDPRIDQGAYGNAPHARHSVEQPSLTRRESQVVQLLVGGKSTKEVAAVLNLSVKTAETHRSNVMSKLGLHSISELVLYAVRNNIVLVQDLDSASPSTAAIASGAEQPSTPTVRDKVA